MLVATSNYIRPTINIGGKLNLCINPDKSFNTRLDLPRKFVSVDFLFWDHRNRLPNNLRMTGPVRTRLGDKMNTLEQEALIDESARYGAGGLEATLNNLSKWVVSVLFAAVILWRHDAEALWATMGAVLNAGLSTVLKRILNQERPISTLRSDPGMPSSHAQSIFYTSIFVILSMVEWFQLNKVTIILSVMTLALGVYFSWLRVSQKLHTISQVVVGALLGSIFSFLWFWSWNAVVLETFVSSLLVRVIVLLAAAVFCLGFLIYVIQNWVMDEA